MKAQKGIFLPLIALIIVVVGLVSTLLFKDSILQILDKESLPTSLPEELMTPTMIPTATPTLSPTLAPTDVPTATPTKSATPKPTQAAVSGPPGAGYSSIKVHTEKGDFSASVLSIDLNSARMITDTANDSDCSDNCSTMSLADFVSRNGGFAGVNGTYFCPDSYPECSGKKNSFDFSVYNTRLGRWINQGMLSWGSRSMVYFDGSGAHYMQGANGFSGGLSAGIVNYPGLLSGGNVQIDDNQSGLSDKQKAKGTKVGIGVRGTKNIMVVVAYNVNMQEFAYVFKALSADGALNLDSGGSTALYYSGRYMLGPGRGLPNAIIFAK
jgi:hypothetical protein